MKTLIAVKNQNNVAFATEADIVDIHGFSIGIHRNIKNNGGGKVKLEGTDREKRQQAKAEICAVEEAHLYVETSEGISKWIFVVLGNEPECTVNDYAPDSGLEAVFEDFEKQWEGKPCPKY